MSFSRGTWKRIREAGCSRSLRWMLGIPAQRAFVNFPSPSTHLLLLGYSSGTRGEVGESCESSLSGEGDLAPPTPFENCLVVSQRPQSSSLGTTTAGWVLGGGGSQRERLEHVIFLLRHN